MGILRVDVHNLHASIANLKSNDALHSALLAAHTTLEMLIAEASRFQIPTEPNWLALHFLRATEFSWAAAVRSMLMLHRCEAMSNVRTALETLGCALIAVRSNADDAPSVAKLGRLLSHTQEVGTKLSRLPPSRALNALKERKKMCSNYGAHGNLNQLAGRLKNERREHSGMVQTLHSDFSYADLEPNQLPEMLAWLVGVAFDAALLFHDDICTAAGFTPSSAFTAKLTELSRHIQVMATTSSSPARAPAP